VLCSAKFNFVWGFGVQILAPLLFATKNLVITSVASYKNLPNLCMSNSVTNLIVNPYLLKIFNHDAVESQLLLRSVVVGGEILPVGVMECYFYKFNKTPLINCYGLTESLFTIVAGKVTSQEPRSIGKALANVALKVVDDHGQSVKIGQLGRLAIKTAHQLSQYADGSNSESFDQGWFYTNDIVKIDHDKNIVFIGRTNSCFKYKGEWHSLLTVEDIILNINGVEDCVVAQLSDQFNDAVITAYVLRSDQSITEKDIFDRCKAACHLNFLMPKAVVFVDNIDRTSNLKKIRKTQR